MKEAAFSLAEAKFTTGDFNQVVLQNVTKAQIKIRSKKDNVAGNDTQTIFTITIKLYLFEFIYKCQSQYISRIKSNDL